METFTKIVNFMIPRPEVPVLGHGCFGHIVKLHYFSENLLLYSWVYFRQAEYKVMIRMEAYTKIVNFLTLIA